MWFSIGIKSSFVFFLLFCSLSFNFGCDSPAELEVFPSELKFNLNETCKDFTVKNLSEEGIFKSGEDLEYQVTTYDNWITPCEGDVCSPGEKQSCHVCINRNRLSSGVNAGAVIISSNGGNAVVGISAECR